MRVHETDAAIAAKNREQGAQAQLWGGMIFAIGMVLVVLAGSGLAIVPVVGLAIGCAGAMVRDSNKIGR